MCKRNLKIQDIMKCAHQFLARKQGTSSSSSIDALSVSETILIDDHVKILTNIESVISLLGKSKQPTIQDVDVLTATVLCSLSDIGNHHHLVRSLLLIYAMMCFEEEYQCAIPFP